MMDSHHYLNPYSGKTFLGFFVELFVRCWGFLTGQPAAGGLASDEVQVLVLSGVAASSALVGTFLVLRKMTMLANSLSHTILVGIVIAFIWTYGISGSVNAHFEPLSITLLMVCALAMGLVTAFLTEILTKGARLQEDASTGLVFTTLFAVGVIAVTLLTRSIHLGTEAVMGNVDALQPSDCGLVYVVLGINLAMLVLFYKEYQISTFDPALSRAFGIPPSLYSYLLMLQVSLTAISAFRAVGVLMLLAFITGPALAARLLTQRLKTMLVLSVKIGVCASVVGVAVSRHMLSVYGIALSTSGVVVCVIVILFFGAALFRSAYRIYSTRVLFNSPEMANQKCQ